MPWKKDVDFQDSQEPNQTSNCSFYTFIGTEHTYVSGNFQTIFVMLNKNRSKYNHNNNNSFLNQSYISFSKNNVLNKRRLQGFP